MEADTLRDITVQISGRKIDGFLECYIPAYAVELTELMTAIHAASKSFPLELSPAPVFMPYLQNLVEKE